MSDLNEQRKYIHDLANNFSIMDASLSRAITMIERSHPEMSEELARLKKADEYMKKSIHVLRSFREHIHAELANKAD